jgi:zinc/manganese transport system substrate-binding protein
VKRVLSFLKPELAAQFDSNLNDFQKRMTSLQNSISGKLKLAQEKSKKGPVLIEYHKELFYFLDLYGLKSYGSIEEKPGVPPSAARLAEVSLGAKKSDVFLAIGSSYHPEKHLKRFSELSGIPYVKTPMLVQKNSSINTIEKLQNSIADHILNAVR